MFKNFNFFHDDTPLTLTGNSLIDNIPDYTNKDPKISLEETLNREKLLRLEYNKLYNNNISYQKLNTKLAEDLKTNQINILQLERKIKENSSTIKTLEQQASQSFRLADQLREKQKEIIKLQDNNNKNNNPNTDYEKEIINLRTSLNQNEKQLNSTLLENRRLQADLLNIKHTISIQPSVVSSIIVPNPSPKNSLPLLAPTSYKMAPPSTRQAPITPFSFGVETDEVKSEAKFMQKLKSNSSSKVTIPESITSPTDLNEAKVEEVKVEESKIDEATVVESNGEKSETLSRSEPNTEVSKLLKKYEDMEASFNQRFREYQMKASIENQNLYDKYQRLKQDFIDQETTVQNYERDLKNIKVELEKYQILKADYTALENSIESQNSKFESLNNQLQQKNAEIANLNTARANLVQQLEKYTGDMKELLNQMQLGKSKLDESTHAYNALQASFTNLQSQYNLTKKENESIQTRYEAKIADLQKQISTFQSQLTNCTQEKNIIAADLEKKKNALAVFHKTLTLKMEAKRAAEIEKAAEEERRIAEEERIYQELIAKEEAERKNSILPSFLQTKRAQTLKPTLRSKTTSSVPTLNTNIAVNIAAGLKNIETKDVPNAELENEMEENVSITLAARLAKAEETNYFLSQQLKNLTKN